MNNFHTRPNKPFLADEESISRYQNCHTRESGYLKIRSRRDSRLRGNDTWIIWTAMNNFITINKRKSNGNLCEHTEFLLLICNSIITMKRN